MLTKSIRLTDEEASELDDVVQQSGEVEASVLKRAALRGLREDRVDRAVPPQGSCCSSSTCCSFPSGTSSWSSSSLAAGQLRLDAPHQGLENAHPRPAQVVRFNHGPGRVGCARLGEHIFDSDPPFPVLTMMPLVLPCDLPSQQGIAQEGAEALLLFLFRDMQPELDQHLAVVRQPALEFVDLRVGLTPDFFLHELVAPLDQHASIKGGPYSQGVYAPRRGEGCFGLVNVIDEGDKIRVIFSGRNFLNEQKISLKFEVPAK